MLTEARGLTDQDLRAVADLERRVATADGGRLKLDWSTLRSRPGTDVDDLLWWQDDRLLGFLGLYQFGSAQLELAGMVDPSSRRAGIGSALLLAAVSAAVPRGFTEALLVTPQSSPGGREFALAQGARLEHSEHFMELGETPGEGPGDPAVSLRPETGADRAEVRAVLAAAFDDGRSEGADSEPEPEPEPGTAAEGVERRLVIERSGVVIGTLRLSPEAEGLMGIYGFAIRPDLQGRGIGRDVLRRVCRQLRGEGVGRVTLEVVTSNERALGLYTSVGFERRATEDYYLLRFSDVPRPSSRPPGAGSSG